MNKYLYHKANQQGFSLLEILIALVIVGILSVIAVNRYTSRSEEARISAAKSELKSIAEGERQVEIDTGFFVTLRALDDSPGLGTIDENGFIQYRIETETTPFSFDTDGSFYFGQFPFNLWKGPYMIYQSVATSDSIHGSPTGISAHGSPLDPWGNPYRLFSEIIHSNPTPVSETGYQLYFPSDRMRVVSYGKNGVPDPEGGDDIVYKF